MKNLFLLLSMVLISAVSTAETKLQIIHNSADAAADSVDIYVNGTLYEGDLKFREATEFRTVPSGTELTIDIAPGNSTDVSSTIFQKKVTLEDNKNYVVVANGIVSASGYDPATTFDLYIYDMAMETAPDGKTNVMVFHGATDAPTVDVVETSVPAGTIINDMAYGEFTGYLELGTMDYILDVRDETGASTVASYAAPLGTLGLGGTALTVVASGFLNPDNNSSGPAFGLFVALPSGGELVELPQYTYDMAKVQVIHNSADAIADSVDVYINGELAIDNFAFRNATPFIELRAGVPTSIDIAPKNSNSVDASIYNLTTTLDSKSYILVANGIVIPSGYNPAQPFNIYVYDMAMETAPDGKTNVMVFHGATDAPTVDVVETSVPAGTIINDMAYGEFTGYLELGNMDYILDVRDETGASTVASYAAPLGTLGLGGTALTVVASGFLNPDNNSSGPAFGLFVALPSGGELVELPLTTTTSIDDVSDSDVKAYPNPINKNITISSNKLIRQLDIFDISGKKVYSGNNSNSSFIQINSENLKSGYYILNVTYSDNSKDSLKLIKE